LRNKKESQSGSGSAVQILICGFCQRSKAETFRPPTFNTIFKESGSITQVSIPEKDSDQRLEKVNFKKARGKKVFCPRRIRRTFYRGENYEYEESFELDDRFSVFDGYSFSGAGAAIGG